MNSRDRILLVALLAMLVGGGALAYYFIITPYSVVNAAYEAEDKKLKEKKSELEKEERDNQRLVAATPLLKVWKLASLPEAAKDAKAKDKVEAPKGAKSQEDPVKKHVNEVQTDYESSYLAPLLRNTGFTNIDIKSKAPDNKRGTSSQNKTSMYTVLSFTVKAQANWAQLQKMLESFHKEALLHQVRSITLQVPQGNRVTTPAVGAGGRGGAAGGAAGRGGAAGGAAGRGGAAGGALGRGGAAPGDGLAGGAPGVGVAPGAPGDVVAGAPAQGGPGGAPGAAAAGGRGGAAGGRGGRQTAADALEVTMTIEALLVNGAETRPTWKPEIPAAEKPQLTPEGRIYEWMVAKNPFYPPAATRPAGGAGGEPPAPRPVVADRNELAFIKLTLIYRDVEKGRWEATFYDQAKGPPERRVNARTVDEFTVFDGRNAKVFDGKVVQLDENKLVFEEKSKDGKSYHYYKLTVGNFLGEATETPLKEDELKALGIKPKVVAAAPAAKPAEPAKPPVTVPDDDDDDMDMDKD